MRADTGSRWRPSRASTGPPGRSVLCDHVVPRGGTIVELDANTLTPEALCESLADHGATALLLLVGHPEPAVPIVRAVRRDRRLADILVGAPAGQPEFHEWSTELGEDGAAIPFLRYLPERLGPLGARVREDLCQRLGEAPSFVALEGWDSVTVLAEVLRSAGADRGAIAESWPHAEVEGSRGLIRFSRTPGITVWQWAGTPIQVGATGTRRSSIASGSSTPARDSMRQCPMTSPADPTTRWLSKRPWPVPPYFDGCTEQNSSTVPRTAWTSPRPPTWRRNERS